MYQPIYLDIQERKPEQCYAHHKNINGKVSFKETTGGRTAPPPKKILGVAHRNLVFNQRDVSF